MVKICSLRKDYQIDRLKLKQVQCELAFNRFSVFKVQFRGSHRRLLQVQVLERAGGKLLRIPDRHWSQDCRSGRVGFFKSFVCYSSWFLRIK